MIQDVLSRLPYQEGFTLDYEGRKYNRPYETITVDGVTFQGLRDTPQRFNLFDSIFQEYNVDFGFYLDIGCNIGSFVNYYSNKFALAEGIEVDKSIVDIGAMVYPKIAGNIQISDINSVSLKNRIDHSCNVITVLSVIEYINDKARFLKDVYDLTTQICIVEGHSEDIIPKGLDKIYENLLRELPWKVIRRPELTDAGLNAPKHSVGRPLWICSKSV
jgi:hypothetical protein